MPSSRWMPPASRRGGASESRHQRTGRAFPHGRRQRRKETGARKSSRREGLHPSMKKINVIGGGLAGVEAAWQAARAGAQVRLFEMRPVTQTPAHRTDRLAEIVCSNSLKSDEVGSAPYLLKEELRRAGSVVMEVAMETKVPAGAALAVDRHKFAELITERIEREPLIRLVREEVKTLPTSTNVHATNADASRADARDRKSVV